MNAQQTIASLEPITDPGLSHNLNGQKLGRKGRVTRERILNVTMELLGEAHDTQISLSAVARRAGLGMTSLYAYFSDLTQLLLAVLEPVMATADAAYLDQLRLRWNDEDLHARSYDFLAAYHAFWRKNSRILHLRNAMSDQRDRRMMLHRVETAQIAMRLLVGQMDGDPNAVLSPAYAMATVLMTGIERTVTIATDAELPVLIAQDMNRSADHFLRPSARLLEMGIRDMRSRST